MLAAADTVTLNPSDLTCRCHMALDLTEYDASQLEALVLLWREAFEFGVGFKDPNPLSKLREYFCSEVLPINRVTLAFSSSQLVGFVAASADFVDHFTFGWIIIVKALALRS